MATYRQGLRCLSHAARQSVRRPLRNAVDPSYAAPLAAPTVASVATTGIDSFKDWTFSRALATEPTLSGVACLQVFTGVVWESPMTVHLSSGAVLSLSYTGDVDGGTHPNWRVSGSTAGLSFAGGGSLVTGASGTVA